MKLLTSTHKYWKYIGNLKNIYIFSDDSCADNHGKGSLQKHFKENK
jgi:hypothetical protein